MIGNSRFQSLLYVNFHIKKKYRVDAVAEKMGLHHDTLYKYANGTNVFPVDQLAPLTIATGDTEYLEYILDMCGYTLLPKIKNRKAAETLELMAKMVLSAVSGQEDGKES